MRRILLPIFASTLLLFASPACGPVDDSGGDGGADGSVTDGGGSDGGTSDGGASDGGGTTDGGTTDGGGGATCTDGVQNGDEEGTDCGGSCPTACPTTCSAGEWRCHENDSQQCVGTDWVMQEDCAATLEVCVPGTPPSCGAVSCNPTMGAGDACGGVLTGAWTFAEACSGDSFQDTVRQACATASVTAETFQYTGSLHFDGPGVGLVARDIDVTASISLSFPKTDVCALMGCGTIESTLQPYVTTVSCSDAVITCECDVTVVSATQDTAAYSATNGTVSIDGRTWYYCVDGGQASFREYGANATEDFFTQVYVR
ncbi:MAG: hypothetical protein P1V51_16390 [Deltaproteobacteria bacterium]|nr:hypothetical protein [Deltaproteobacteria bacterium]